MLWIEMGSPDDKKIPKWKRSVGLSNESVVFVPAAIAGNENNVYLCAAYDASQTVRYLNHIYVSADWLAIEFPNTKAVCETISIKVREICSQNSIANT